ncbi:MAG: alanine/ornithine racemase family PLP-dependent enzyme [Anaerolineae bacterium]|nr:alanine/ornithine racemase family PLP-dependent enzyme [Anaerolineae bacterium]
MSVRLRVDLNRIEANARRLIQMYGARGIAITAVTKGVCGAPAIAAALVRAGIRSLGDSRLDNIQRMRAAGIPAEFMLISPPAVSEVARAVRLADVSLNSEPSVIRLLATHARALGKTHGILMMVEMGDLREGIMPAELHDVIEQVLALRGVHLTGLATNLACLSGVVPTDAKMAAFSRLVARAEARFGLALETVSGGNSANHRWVMSGAEPGRVNHLRIGEAILLGRETVERRPIAGLATDAFTLVGEVIEVKTKPARPYGEIGQTALGRRPLVRGGEAMRRAIVGLGEQDVDPDAIRPRLQAEIVGACSDQLVLHDRAAALAVGSQVEFDVGYGALLRAMTSPCVAKVYIPRGAEVRPDVPRRPCYPAQPVLPGRPGAWQDAPVRRPDTGATARGVSR